MWRPHTSDEGCSGKVAETCRLQYVSTFLALKTKEHVLQLCFSLLSGIVCTLATVACGFHYSQEPFSLFTSQVLLSVLSFTAILYVLENEELKQEGIKQNRNCPSIWLIYRCQCQALLIVILDRLILRADSSLSVVHVVTELCPFEALLDQAVAKIQAVASTSGIGGAAKSAGRVNGWKTQLIYLTLC